ncbi:MAG: 4-alpha-glucanotransferase [Myxococcales bacterium]|nr:4-alpha-glucanotransferase [Myxococcales bacterium]
MSTRRAGLLLHPTSLPGPYGIGDVGPAARELLAWMDAAELRIWQVLPLTPVDTFGSPYASDSTLAMEPLLLSIDDLVEDGWLLAREKPFFTGRGTRVDWPAVTQAKAKALGLAAERAVAAGAVQLEPPLEDYALFRALTREQGAPWHQWPEPLRRRDPAALAAARDRLAASVARQRALQWLIGEQWARLRRESTRLGVDVWGDVPFFVGLDSCDVWCRPDLWRLDDDGLPEAVSGVPPDAFSAEGQLWGHPLFREGAHADEGFAWWIARFERALQTVDCVRIDHFRGVCAVWENAADATTAMDGTWVPGPGRPLLAALRERFEDMPFLAEDLGIVTEDVTALRQEFALPGMTILQFAFDGGADHAYLPHNHQRDRVCYTGTHDNDTTVGWVHGLDETRRDRMRRYLATSDRDAPYALMRAAWRSVCDTTILPLQDILGLGADARMNVPGTSTSNWSWRAGVGAFSLSLASRVADEVRISGRHQG